MFKYFNFFFFNFAFYIGSILIYYHWRNPTTNETYKASDVLTILIATKAVMASTTLVPDL